MFDKLKNSNFNAIKVTDKRTSVTERSKFKIFSQTPQPQHKTLDPKLQFTKKSKKNMSFLRSFLTQTPTPSLNNYICEEEDSAISENIETNDCNELRKIIQDKDLIIKGLRSELDIMKTALNAISKNKKNHGLGAISDVVSEAALESLSSAGKSPKKREGISAEPNPIIPFNKIDVVYYDKNIEAQTFIKDALKENEFLKNLDKNQLQEIALCMQEKTYEEKDCLIKEGESGNTLFVGAVGRFEVRKNDEVMSIMNSGRCFGELALLYNCRRTASVIALTKAKVWALDRDVFQAIMMRSGLQRLEERKNFLKSIPLLKTMSSGNISKLTDVLEIQKHKSGECIIRQGELADSFYIIQSGKVLVTVKEPSNGEEVELRILEEGQYFGEKALVYEEKRTANCYAYESDVQLLCLYKKDFNELVGTIQEIKEKNYPDERDLIKKNAKIKSTAPTPKVTPTSPIATTVPSVFNLDTDPKNPTLDRKNKKRVKFNPNNFTTLAILGIGGFGRVELVINPADPSKSYAMKRMRKSHIVKTKQQDHVLSEKDILYALESPFICRLYATAKDDRFVYLLMEACLGGELWTILRDMRKTVGHLSEKHVRFSLACVILAFAYLHANGIIYRDLKPENLVIAEKGYLKLCDFGFAKYIGYGSKTWTFCGTPEYVAPEVILNKGHDFSADYWSLGILTCELLTGLPPFQASEPIKIYTKTLKGIDALDLNQNKYISLKAYNFIKKLCRQNPIERLGVGKNGINDIKNHKYFHGFDWDGLSKFTLPSPFKYKVENPTDNSNFDKFPVTELRSSIESSGWDENF